MPAHPALLVQRAPPPPPNPQNIGDAIRDQVRQSVQGAMEGRRAAEDAFAGNTPGAKMAIDALRAEMNAEAANIKALTAQLVPGISDARTEALTSQLSNAEDHLESLQSQMERALSSQVPGMMTQPPPFPPDMIPPQAVEMVSIVFVSLAVIAIGVPIARAIARRLDRRGQVAPASPTLEPRLDRIEQAIEAIAIEVERVSEGQRFTNKLMGEIRALPLPNAAEQWPQGRKEAVVVERGRQE